MGCGSSSTAQQPLDGAKGIVPNGNANPNGKGNNTNQQQQQPPPSKPQSNGQTPLARQPTQHQPKLATTPNPSHSPVPTPKAAGATAPATSPAPKSAAPPAVSPVAAPAPPAVLSPRNNLATAPAAPLSPTNGGLPPLKAPSHLAPLKAPGGGAASPLGKAPLTSPPSPAAAVKKCDADGSHIATLFCEDCEEYFCNACDATFHSRKKTASHTRRKLGADKSSAPLAAPSPHGLRVQAGASANPSVSPSPSPPAVVPSPRSGAPPATAQAPKAPHRPSFVAAAATVIAAQPMKTNGKKVTLNGAPVDPQQNKQQGYVRQGSLIQKSAAASPMAPQKVQGHAIAPAGGLKPLQEEKYINAVPIEKLKTLSGNQLNIIWSQYDTDGNGTLDRRELKLLASDCIARTLRMFEDEIKKQNPGISESALKAAVERERMCMLPGKDKDESHKEMVKMLVRKLDVNGDGSVTKAELMMQWNSFSKELFTMRTEGALDCSIM